MKIYAWVIIGGLISDILFRDDWEIVDDSLCVL